MKRLALAALTIVTMWLSGCATTTEGGVPISTRYNAVAQDSRAQFLILHYTVLNLPDSIKVLTERQVSSHYLVGDEPSPRIYRLVDESRRAYHAGISGWEGTRMLNASSIGIEIVHPGARVGPDGERIYLPYPEAQIEALIPLVKDIAQRHQIKPERILGHAEIAPTRKQDPGPTFPWKRFSELGITPPWPDAARVAQERARFEAAPPDVAWWQAAFTRHGAPIERTGVLDEQTNKVLASFQMRYRPERYDGVPDAETAALLHVLTNPLPAPPK